MSYKSTYHKGEWLAICDDCGKKVKSSKLKKRWDGLMVDAACWEPRHPQDFVRAKVDIQATPWTRPESTDIFVAATYTGAIADYAIAGAAIAGKTNLPDQVPSSTFNV